MIAGLLGLCLACTFFGAAVYINVAEHPARRALDATAALIQWVPSYDRAFSLQGGLAIASASAGYLAAWLTSDLRWCVGATLMLANWPYTVLGILPLNKRLKAGLPTGTSETRSMLERWNRLHSVRSLLSILAVAAYAWVLTTQPDYPFV